MDTEEFILRRQTLRDRMEMRRRQLSEEITYSFSFLDDPAHPVRNAALKFVGKRLMSKLPLMARVAMAGAGVKILDGLLKGGLWRREKSYQ